MKIAVVDGQGGGLGKTIVEKLRQKEKEFNKKIEIIALGTNVMATSAMLKAGADEGASGENAIVVSSKKVDFIMGSIGIIASNSMLGEITPKMASAIAESSAKKILIPLNRCGIYVSGIKDEQLADKVNDALNMLKKLVE